MFAYKLSLLLLFRCGVGLVGCFGLRLERLPFAELGVVAGEVLYLTIATEHEQMVDNLVHEESVVRYYYDASGEVLQIFLQHLKRLYVEVVGRLVEYEEVGIAHKYRTEVKLASFASREFVHIVVLLFGGKEEMLQQLSCRNVLASAVVDVFGYVGYHVDYALLVVEFHSVLREVAEPYRVAYVKLSAVGANFAKQHLDERRFSRAVVAYDSHLLEALEVVVEVFEDDFFIESLRHILALEYFRADVHILRLESHLSFFHALLSFGFEVVKRLLTVACLMSTCLGLSAHPFQFAAIQIVGTLYFGTCGIDALLTLLHIVAEVAAIGIYGMVVEFENEVAHAVEEVAVVCHHQERLVAP